MEVVVWGYMISNEVDKMKFVHGIMNQYKCQWIVDQNVKPSVQNLAIGKRSICQQDDNPKHSEMSIMEYLKKTNLSSWNDSCFG